MTVIWNVKKTTRADNKHLDWAHIQQVYFVFIIIDQEWIPRGETSRAKPKIGDKDKHVATDDTEDTNAGIDNIYL